MGLKWEVIFITISCFQELFDTEHNANHQLGVSQGLKCLHANSCHLQKLFVIHRLRRQSRPFSSGEVWRITLTGIPGDSVAALKQLKPAAAITSMYTYPALDGSGGKSYATLEWEWEWRDSQRGWLDLGII